MRYIFLITTLLTTMMTLPAAAVSLSCNSAVQNWQNGSRTTCPYSPSGHPTETAQIAVAPPAAPPPPVVEDQPNDTVEISFDDILR
jgi:hypothetical protein